MFSQIARVVAIIGLVGGLLQVGLGLAIATGVIGPYDAALARYTTASSSGEVIDEGTRVWLIALALGTLAEIGIAVRRGIRSAAKE
jgi:hypothetical protein